MVGSVADGPAKSDRNPLIKAGARTAKNKVKLNNARFDIRKNKGKSKTQAFHRFNPFNGLRDDLSSRTRPFLLRMAVKGRKSAA